MSPSPSIAVVAHCWLAAAVFLTVRTAAGYVHRPLYSRVARLDDGTRREPPASPV